MINLINHYANGEKLYAQVIESVYKKYELTYMEFNVIMFLFNNPKYDTASHIVKYRHLAKSHVSTSVQSLINKGYLIGEYRDDNHKTIHLKLTDATKPITKEGLETQKQYLKMITEDFSNEERETLWRFIKKIDENVDKYLK